MLYSPIQCSVGLYPATSAQYEVKHYDIIRHIPNLPLCGCGHSPEKSLGMVASWLIDGLINRWKTPTAWVSAVGMDNDFFLGKKFRTQVLDANLMISPLTLSKLQLGQQEASGINASVHLRAPQNPTKPWFLSEHYTSQPTKRKNEKKKKKVYANNMFIECGSNANSVEFHSSSKRREGSTNIHDRPICFFFPHK